MKLLGIPARPATRTLRVLSRLLGYPDTALRSHLPELRNALHAEAALPPMRLRELDALIADLARRTALDVEADYVQLFDSGRRTALHLFEHVHGDSRERGPAMIDLAQTYEKAGLYLAPGEMPDHLPVVLEFVSTQPAKEATAFLSEIAHLVNGLLAALSKRESRYAAVMGAILDLAGVPARPIQVPGETPVDAAWEEPVAFDGCGSASSVAGTAKPVRLVPRASRPSNGVAP